MQDRAGLVVGESASVSGCLGSTAGLVRSTSFRFFACLLADVSEKSQTEHALREHISLHHVHILVIPQFAAVLGSWIPSDPVPGFGSARG